MQDFIYNLANEILYKIRGRSPYGLRLLPLFRVYDFRLNLSNNINSTKLLPHQPSCDGIHSKYNLAVLCIPMSAMGCSLKSSYSVEISSIRHNLFDLVPKKDIPLTQGRAFLPKTSDRHRKCRLCF